MHPVLRNILGVLAGLIIGSAVNMSIISLSAVIIPPPEGADVSTMEGLQAALPLFQPKHFIMPFLAHAIGTIVGAALAALIAGSRKMLMAYLVGVFFLIGGIANVLMLPAPFWFDCLDLLLAYFPMAWFGGRLVGGHKRKSNRLSA